MEPSVRTGITAPLIHVKMVVHAEAILVVSHVLALQDTVVTFASLKISAHQIPAEMVGHA